VAALAAGAQILTFVAAAVTTAPSTYNVATSGDQQLTTAPAVPSLGGTLTAGTALVFTPATAIIVPGAVNTNTIGFTPATAVPVGGTVSLLVPLNYFTAVVRCWSLFVAMLYVAAAVGPPVVNAPATNARVCVLAAMAAPVAVDCD